MFASGGHSEQIFAIGIPSTRLLRSIAVYTPERERLLGEAHDEQAQPTEDLGAAVGVDGVQRHARELPHERDLPQQNRPPCGARGQDHPDRGKEEPAIRNVRDRRAM